MPETKLRLGQTLRTAMKRRREINRLSDLYDKNAQKLHREFPVAAGQIHIDNLCQGSPALALSVTESGTFCQLRLLSPEDIAALRDFLNEHFPPPAKRRK